MRETPANCDLYDPPAIQAGVGGSPLNGVVPPPEHRWKAGQSGNRRGRPAAGLSIKEWFNVMATWNRDQLQAVVDDPKESIERVSAARSWLTAGIEGAADALREICDRTSGRPIATMELNVADPWNNEPNIIISPETIALQHRLAKQLAQRQAEKAKALPANADAKAVQ